MEALKETQDRLLTCDQAASLLAISPATLRTWTSRRAIAFVKLNGRRTVRYRLSAIEQMIQAGEHLADSNLNGTKGGHDGTD